MRNIIAATAFALSLSTAYAASHTGAPFYQDTLATGDIYASTLEGMRVYVPEGGLGEGFAYTPGLEAEWDDVGEVNNIILNVDGSVKAVVLGIGGFLGIGEKDVAVSMDQLQFVAESDDAGDFFIVLETTREALEAAPDYDSDQPSTFAGGVTRPMAGAGAAALGTAIVEKDDAMMAEGDKAEAMAETETVVVTEGDTETAAAGDANGVQEVEAGDTTERSAEANIAGSEEAVKESAEELAGATADTTGEATEMTENGEKVAMAAGEKMENAADATMEKADAAMEKTADAMETTTETVAIENPVASDTQPPAQPGMLVPVEREGYAMVETSALTADMLEGTRVYGVNDEDVGEVGEILLDDSGKVKDVVLDVGGFLGLGEREVAVPMDRLQILRNDAGDDVRIYIDATQDALEALPEYEG